VEEGEGRIGSNILLLMYLIEKYGDTSKALVRQDEHGGGGTFDLPLPLSH